MWLVTKEQVRNDLMEVHEWVWEAQTSNDSLITNYLVISYSLCASSRKGIHYAKN